MNHLAHFHLSFNDADLVIGNWLADFIRQKEVAAFSPAVQRGIFLHRKIDSFSDEHPLMREAAARLRPFSGKYSNVLVDIFNDHLLAKNWPLFSEKPLDEFARGIYFILEKRQSDLPADLRERTLRMISADWLTGYGSAAGLENVVARFKKRLAGNEFFERAAPDLDGATRFFLENVDLFEADFRLFYGELRAEIQPLKPTGPMV